MGEVAIRRYVDGRLVDATDAVKRAALMPQVSVPKATRVEAAAKELAGLPARVAELERQIKLLAAQGPPKIVAAKTGMRHRVERPKGSWRRSIYGLQDIELHDSRFFPADGIDIHVLAKRVSQTCTNWHRLNPERFSTTMKDGGIWVTRTR